MKHCEPGEYCPCCGKLGLCRPLQCAGEFDVRYCPEHGCELEPDGTCLGCASFYDDNDYWAIHHDIGDK